MGSTLEIIHRGAPAKRAQQQKEASITAGTNAGWSLGAPLGFLIK
jgi:hypothetical protein